MWRFVIGILLIVHGLIVGAQSPGNFGSSPGVGVDNPSWLSWWPANLGQSWLLTSLGIEKGLAFSLVGLLWPALAVAGAAISLCLLVLFFHPLFALGMLVDVSVLIALLWVHWPAEILVS